MAVTNKSIQQIVLKNDIYVDGEIVKQQSCEITSTDLSNPNLQSWIINNPLYKENRVEIREMEAQFEEMCYQKQEELISKATLTE